MGDLDARDGTVNVERVGAVDSDLRTAGGERRGAVLTRHGFDEASYLTAKEAAKSLVDEGLARGDSCYVVAYASAFRRAKAAASPSVSPAEASASAPGVASIAPPVPVNVPTYLAPERVVRKRPPASGDPLDGTVEVINGAMPRSLPFVRITEETSQVTDATREEPAPRPRDGLGGTRDVDDRYASREVLPFLGVGGSRDELTLEQYASLCAELATFGKEKQMERALPYGVTDDIALVTLHGRWRARFEVDPDLHRKFTELRDAYRAWLGHR
jgi:hypothetical protein